MKRAFLLLVISTSAASGAALAACSSDSSGPADASASDARAVFPDGAAAASEAKVLCTESADGGYMCNCPSPDAGAAVEAGAVLFYASAQDCEEGNLAGTTLLCCADDDYPASGSCGCTEDSSERPYHCEEVDPGSCQCDYTPNLSDASASCDPSMYGDGGTCCAFRGTDFDESVCRCYSAAEGVGCGAAGSGSVMVSSCTSAGGAGLQVVPSACPGGTNQVTACGAHALP